MRDSLGSATASMPSKRRGRSPDYALEKLAAAVHSLAVGPGDVRSRLYSAFVDIFILTPEDFPPSFRRRYRSIRYQLSKRQARGREGRVVATLSRMRNSTGSTIARKIVDLYDRLDDYLGSRR
jgi:hypothetical protein